MLWEKEPFQMKFSSWLARILHYNSTLGMSSRILIAMAWSLCFFHCRNLKVIDNVEIQMEMSLAIEPRNKNTLAAWCWPCSVHICYVFVCVWSDVSVFRLARNLNLIRACGVRTFAYCTRIRVHERHLGYSAVLWREGSINILSQKVDRALAHSNLPCPVAYAAENWEIGDGKSLNEVLQTRGEHSVLEKRENYIFSVSRPG